MKLIPIVLIVLVAATVLLFVTDGALFHPARTLPFNSRGPVQRNYELAGLIMLGLFCWALHKLRNRDGQDR
jgi:hypothetical protein